MEEKPYKKMLRLVHLHLLDLCALWSQSLVNEESTTDEQSFFEEQEEAVHRLYVKIGSCGKLNDEDVAYIDHIHSMEECVRCPL